MLNRLTPKQKQVLNVIVNYYNQHKDSPSIRVIRDVVAKDISHIAINDRIKALVVKGYLENDEGKYYPTTEGLDQLLLDAGDLARIKLTNK